MLLHNESKMLVTGVFNRAVWLATSTKSGPAPAGTGFFVERNGREYLVTARHVAQSCGYNPRIICQDNAHADSWTTVSQMTWTFVGEDETSDVAVLTTHDVCIFGRMRMILRLGNVGINYGSVGYALGFPADLDPSEAAFFKHSDAVSMPLPIPALATFYMSRGNLLVCSGYTTYGYSGGPLLFVTPFISNPTDEQRELYDTHLGGGRSPHVWTVCGICVARGGNPRPVDMDGATLDISPKVDEPSGIIKYASIDVATHIIDNNPIGMPVPN